MIKATSLQLNARYQRYIVVSRFLPSRHGTISTVTPHDGQATRRIW
jgi:hypothetical protein